MALGAAAFVLWIWHQRAKLQAAEVALGKARRQVKEAEIAAFPEARVKAEEAVASAEAGVQQAQAALKAAEQARVDWNAKAKAVSLTPEEREKLAKEVGI